MKITTLCASVLALTVVSQAHAEPTARMTTESGADRSGFVEYDLSYPQFDGVSDELNQAIKALAMRPVTEIVTLQAQEAGPGPNTEPPATVGVEVTPHLVNDRVISVSVSSTVYFPGAAHPSTGVDAATYRLPSTEPVGRDELVRPADMPQLLVAVNKVLAATYGDGGVETVTAENFGSVYLREGGVTVIWGSYAIGPYALGTPSVDLPYLPDWLFGVEDDAGLPLDINTNSPSPHPELDAAQAEVWTGGRVMGNTVQLELDNGERVPVAHDTSVKILANDRPDTHRVRLPDGQVGELGLHQVLLERQVKVDGLVYGMTDGTTWFGGRNGLEILPKDGPNGTTDLELMYLRDMLQPISGSKGVESLSEPLTLSMIERKIGDRHWYAVVDYAPHVGEAEASPAQLGMKEALEALNKD